jgi:2-polyprenyl-3-methyl-5-hydroxy-6-metoxy-1,4-benzoquinol methylase
MIDYERLYQFRFRRVDDGRRQRVWDVIAPDVYRKMRRPKIILDVGGGAGEFINAVPAEERWLVDRQVYGEVDSEVKIVIGDLLEVDLPREHFDGVFISNVLEHLPTQESVGMLLRRLRHFTKPDGVMAIMGPNFRYCAKRYFDCADHTLALTHASVEEHLYAAGFNPLIVRKRYLPYSFTGHLPTFPLLVSAYLKMTPAQSLFGKQFFVVASRA